MAAPKDYNRDVNGIRMVPGGINTVLPADSLPQNKYAYLANVRGYKQNQIVSRATESTALVSGLPTPVHSLRLLSDSTPLGPGFPYYIRVIGAAGTMWVDSTQYASGLSGNPISLCPFRPNASVQPWMYTADSSLAVTLITEFLINGSATTFVSNGMNKVRSDGLIFKTGIEEPQIAPSVSTQNYTTTRTDVLPATSVPWTNVGGINTNYNYGQTSGSDGTPAVIITGGGPSLIAGSTVTLTVTETASVNGLVHAPGDSGPSSASYPGHFITTPLIVVGAFTDNSGNVVPPGGLLPIVFNVGAGPTTVTVPAGATELHVGVDSSANTFYLNSGIFSLTWSVTVSAVATVLSTVGPVTAYVWGTPPPAGGGSPHSGPVASYIWKNPNDGGSGISRSITDPVPDATPTGNSWVFDSTPEDGTVPVNWNVLNVDGSIASTIPLFSPALESEGYQDFNCCVVGSLFVPAAGTYAFTLQYKDQIMFGIGGGASVSGGPVNGSRGQTMTVVDALPLLFVSTVNGSGTHQTTTVNVTFPDLGVYQIEVDWDYWFHSGRSLIMTVPSTSPNSPTIPPLPFGVRTSVQYRYVYRSSATGALSNPSPESPVQQTPVLANLVTPTYSLDPQVDKIDYYRIDQGLDNFTYVATGPNTNDPVTPIEDQLTDIEVANNPILQFDNYEPFPVIDLPHKGIVNVSGGVITWVSGDVFNTRWLPGTLIKIGYPTSVTYSFIARPTSTTQVTIPEVPDGTNLVYEIPEPDLAAQPLPYIWGPTDNTAFMFGVGDQLNPGTLYFTKGNNPDSAPQTNQISVTSPSEPLINGVKTAAMGMVWTAERRWLIYPTFETALATVEGVAGTPFNVVEATGSKGLYIPTCVCTDGGMTAFLRAKDGIYACSFGGSDEFICQDIYNLFPREGVIPQPITIAGYTIYPPNDILPNAQKLSWANGYLYYDYLDNTDTNQPRTLVYDTIAGGWSVDEGQFPFTVHALEEGPEVNTVMVGCNDGTVRVLGSGNAETETSVVIPGCQNGGDARAFKRVGDVFIKALVAASNPIAVALYANRYAQALAGFSPTSLTGTGSLSPYIVDFTSGYGDDLIDLGLSLSWPIDAGNILDLWSPTFLPLPPSTQDQPTDWSDGGYAGAKFVQGVILERNTFGANKVFQIQSGDDLTLHTPNETPCNFNGQGIQAFSVSPFIAHTLRVVSSDGVPWNAWGTEFQFKPYPEDCIEWQTEFFNFVKGWQSVRYFNVTYISPAPVTLTLTFDQWPNIVISNMLPATPSQLYPVKTFVQCPVNKSKLVGFNLTSTARWRPFKNLAEVVVMEWGRSGSWSIVQPWGGESAPGAEV